RTIVVRSGEYRWSGLRIHGAYGIVRYRVDRDEEWTLRVVAGRINYPGTLVIHKRRNAIGSALAGGVENRSARTWLELKRSAPELLARYGLSYGGAQPDAFLAELEKVRAAHSTRPTAAAGASRGSGRAPSSDPCSRSRTAPHPGSRARSHPGTGSSPRRASAPSS